MVYREFFKSLAKRRDKSQDTENAVDVDGSRQNPNLNVYKDLDSQKRGNESRVGEYQIDFTQDRSLTDTENIQVI